MTFGNSGSGLASSHNVDINGNGTTDPGEKWVRSIGSLLALKVPAQTAATDAVTLTDTAADIATTGTVTYSNPVINLGATGSTVSVTYGGASGGSITNWPQLTGAGTTVTVGGFTLNSIQKGDSR